MIGFAQGFCLASNICSWSDALVAYYLYVSFLAVVWFSGRATHKPGSAMGRE